MIAELEKRRSFWESHHIVQCQGDSIAMPFNSIDNYKALFAGKRILEIGPGEGRQFDALHHLAATYSVADIVPAVLNQPRYTIAHARHLIDNYESTDLGATFDLITFWYVLHHVRLDEADTFFDFLTRHLALDGRLIFNAPHANPKSEYAKGSGDGCATTPWNLTLVIDLLHARNFTIEQKLDLAPNCLVFVASLLAE